MSVPPVQEYILKAQSELRIEIERQNKKVTLVLKDGLAEIFGTELCVKKEYEFYAGAKFALFTWKGCTIELNGKPDIIYISEQTPMVIYSNVHVGLEQKRTKAQKFNGRGPMVLVVGPVDVGKSTLSRILLNYAVRSERRPILVDLDVGQGQISVPGTIGSILIKKPATIDEGFCQIAPLVYHFGYKSPGENFELFDVIMSKLAERIFQLMEKNDKAKVSGCIINTCGWVRGAGYKILTRAAQVFRADLICVLDNERLFNELNRDIPKFVNVICLPKSGGVVEKTKICREENRYTRIKDYFYGRDTEISPHLLEVKFSDVKIFKIGATLLPDSCMPIGMHIKNPMTKIVPVQPSASLLYHLLAVSLARNPNDDMIRTNVAGYICVTAVDMNNQVFTVLSPQPSLLPNTLLILSDILFMESE